MLTLGEGSAYLLERVVYILVIYDIPKNALRKRVSDCCLDAGLERIQYSVFLGQGGRLMMQELASRLKSILGDEGGLVHLMPVHKDQLKYTEVIYNEWPSRTI